MADVTVAKPSQESELHKILADGEQLYHDLHPEKPVEGTTETVDGDVKEAVTAAEAKPLPTAEAVAQLAQDFMVEMRLAATNDQVAKVFGFVEKILGL